MRVSLQSHVDACRNAVTHQSHDTLAGTYVVYLPVGVMTVWDLKLQLASSQPLSTDCSTRLSHNEPIDLNPGFYFGV